MTFSAGSILLGLALLLGVVLFIAWPFLSSQSRASRPSLRRALLLEKEAILARVRELDFDHETGKVPDEAHQQRRAKLLSEAAAILQKLDELGDDGQLEPLPRSPVSDVDREIEAAVARLRLPAAAPATQPARQPNGAIKFCPQCGHSIDKDDKFCAHCGHTLRRPERG